MDCDADIGLCSMLTVLMEWGSSGAGNWEPFLELTTEISQAKNGAVERKLLTKFTNQSGNTKATRASAAVTGVIINSHPGMSDLMRSGDP